MIGTYAAVVAVCGSSLAIGQAAVALCGQRRWSWLAPAVGLALVMAVCWATVRLPGHGVISALAVLALTVAAVAFLWRGLEGGGEALRAGWPVALAALVAASLPFAVEGHFGILGTSFNPDMSQHLLATARLADGHSSQLLHQGYPLGPHSVVVALNKGLGIGLVHGFSGLSVAVMVLAPLTALAAFRELAPLPRTAGALVVGLAYLVASYFAQGAFKETIEALLVLAFALALREATRPEWRELPLRFVPAALLAVGAVYAYSFPGVLWLGGTFVIWALVLAALGRRQSSPAGPGVVRAALLGLLVFVVLVAPEVGRMIDFHNFETFDPNGPGLGNLFGQVSPLEALGIWPSGDFRLAPGDGAVPAVGYYLGAVFALALLVWGALRCWRRREVAVLAALATAALAYVAARAGGTAYTAAKAIEVAAPLAALTISLPLATKSRFQSPLRRTKEPRDGRPSTRGSKVRTHGQRNHAMGGGGVAGPGACRLCRGGGGLLAAGLRQRAGRAGVLLAGADRAAAAGRERLDPGARFADAARRRTRRPLHRLGAARRPGLRRRRWRTRLAPARRPLRRHPRHSRRTAVPRPQGAPGRPALCPLGSPRPPRRPQPLPAGRRPPGPPGLRPLTGLPAWQSFWVHTTAKALPRRRVGAARRPPAVAAYHGLDGGRHGQTRRHPA